MIDFYSNEYIDTGTRYSNVHYPSLWPYESKVKMYTEDLKRLNKYFIDELNASILTYSNKADPVDEELVRKLEIWRDRQENDYKLQYLYDNGREIYVEPDEDECPESEANYKCLLKLILNRTEPKTPIVPPPNEAKVFSEKIVDFYNKYFAGFQNYYLQARQLNNYDCQYMPTFRRLFVFTNGMVDGRIFGYFDVKMNNLYNELQDVLNIIKEHYLNIQNLTWDDDGGKDDDGNLIIDRVIDDYFDEIFNLYADRYNPAVTTYRYDISIGVDEMEEIINTANYFLFSLNTGINVISTANISLTADRNHDDMLIANSRNGFTMTQAMNPALSDTTRNLMLDNIKVQSTVTQIALEMKKSIEPDYSNFEFIMSNCVTVGLVQTGTKRWLERMQIVLGMYEK